MHIGATLGVCSAKRGYKSSRTSFYEVQRADKRPQMIDKTTLVPSARPGARLYEIGINTLKNVGKSSISILKLGHIESCGILMAQRRAAV